MFRERSTDILGVGIGDFEPFLRIDSKECFKMRLGTDVSRTHREIPRYGRDISELQNTPRYEGRCSHLGISHHRARHESESESEVRDRAARRADGRSKNANRKLMRSLRRCLVLSHSLTLSFSHSACLFRSNGVLRRGRV